jgi:putative hydrolase of the HAD superfamily
MLHDLMSGDHAPVRWIGLDADDTLWHSETIFAVTQERFTALVAPFVEDPSDLERRLLECESSNLALFGYGIKGFTLSMIETAIEVTDGAIPADALRVLLDIGKEMLAHPVDLLDGVAETVAELRAAGYKLLVITKGDLLHQESKVAASGLVPHFHGIEVVSEKDPDTYARILTRYGIAPSEFVMVGNSVRSDILPALAIGARAVHIPYVITWGHEHAEADEGSYAVMASIRDLPAWLASGAGAKRPS